MANIHWHLGYYGAAKMELKRDKKSLEFDRESHLTEEALRMDMLVIKKRPAKVISNEVGKIFKKHNIWEFKGFKGSLNIDSYYKAVGYACIYKTRPKRVNEIPKEEVTVTFLRQAYPRDMFKILKEDGVVITEKYPGIYYLTGNVMFDTQVIVVKELDHKKHPALKVITRDADEDDIRRFLDEASLVTEPQELLEVQAVLQVSMAANEKLYEDIMRRDQAMSNAVKNVMKDVIEEERADASTIAILENIRKMMKNLKLTAQQAMQALELSAEEQKKYSAMI